MARFAWMLFLSAILWRCSAISPLSEDERQVLILKSIVEKVDEIRTILEEQQTKSSALEESQMTMKNDMNQMLRKMADLEEQRIDYQECATRDQVETIQNTFIAERQELRDSLQRCNVRDEFPTLYNTLKTDVDECKINQHTCHVNATCANTIGGYNCRCNLPYAGDGYSTCDLVCKSPSVWIDTLGCITLIASCGCTWEEAKAKCQGEGSRLTENIHNKDFNSLVHHFGETTKTVGIWVGGMREKWVSTGDNISPDTFTTGNPKRREGQNCIDLGLGKDKIGLEDAKCSTTYYALCQSYYEGIVS